MKKLLAMLLTLLLLIPCAMAESELTVVDLGDFTLEINPDTTPSETGEKTDGGVLFVAYPGYDENDAVSEAMFVNWSQTYEDVTAMDPETVSQQNMEAYIEQYATSNIIAANPQFLRGEYIAVDGLPALYVLSTLDIDFSGTGEEPWNAIYAQVLTGSEEMGLYTLTVGAEDEEVLLEGIGIIESLKWKNRPADAAPALVTVDLGDFTLAVDPKMPGEILEKEDQTSFFMAYPNYDENAEFHSNFNIVWTQAYEDVTAQDPEALTRQIMEKNAAELADSGIAVDNLQFIQAAVEEVDGKPALFAMYAMDLDYSGTGYDLQCTVVYAQVITGSEEMGLYTFTAGATDEEGLMAGVNIIDTLKWK